MRTILMTAYAVDPYKGSEEGTGWNLICQAARFNKVLAITRKNNRPQIEKYIQESKHNPELYGRIRFFYFDFPAWMIRWKKGPLLSALYFYLWQLGVLYRIRREKMSFDLVHSVNFHSNWTPSFLWILGKPFVWGPVGNHPLIPSRYLLHVYGWKALLKDRMLWIVKQMFWKLDPFLALTRRKAKHVFCVNSQSVRILSLSGNRYSFMPAVASEDPGFVKRTRENKFLVLSVGRFVPLKGFDLAIRSFAQFSRKLTPDERQHLCFQIIGTGPEKSRLESIILEEGVQDIIEIHDWMPRAEVVGRFRHASAYLFPSHEGAGMVVAEALSYAVPVVCLDNYGPGEYIHPESSLRVVQGSYEEVVAGLSDKLMQLYVSDDEWARESALARARYEAIFQWNTKGDNMRQVYDRLIAGEASIHHSFQTNHA